MRFRVPVSVLIAALVFVSALAIPVTAQTDGIPASIRAGLQAGGVNLQFGFYDSASYQPRDFDNDLPLIRAYGAGHVRLPISWDVLFGTANSSTMVESRYQDIVGFVNRAKAAGLVTIVDIHNTRQRVNGGASGNWNEDYMVDIGSPAGRQRHITGLTALAARLYADNVDRNWFVLQPANEPIFDGYGGRGAPQTWYDHQSMLLPALRAGCPDCVLFAMAHDWQGIDALVREINPDAPPYNDPLLIFDVHFYEPMEFTHCGYTAQTHNCNDAGRQYPGMITTWRGTEMWNAALIRERFRPVVEWAARYGVVWHASEIGTFVHARGRTQYLADVTSAIRQGGGGWSLYDWRTGNFGIKQDAAVLSAVGFGNVAPVPTAAPNVGTSTPRPPTATPTQQSTIVPTATATVSAGFDPVAALTEMRDLRAQQDALRERIAALRQQLLAWIQGE